MGMSSKKQTIGYKYGGTLHMGLGLAADEIYQIDIGEKTAWQGSIRSNGTFSINQPNLFGGTKAEGGVEGNVDVLFGDANQAQHGRLASLLGNAIPAFRGTVTMVFSGFLCAMNWYPKTWDIYYRRIASGWPDNSPWYPEKITIWLADGAIQAMNPAHILYESYISDTWGAGEPRSRMDDAAYRKAADTLYAEGFGLCFEWKAAEELKSLRQYVCDHIGAIVGTDPSTGKNTIRLIRDDYNVDELPVFDEDHGLLEATFEATNNSEVPCQVIVKYTDATTFEERPAYANNPAIAQGQRGKNTETTEYLGIPTGDIATRVAYRDLKSKTSGIKRCTLKLDRRAYDIVLGQPFRVKTKYRINNFDMIVRADKRTEKFLTDGTITLEAVQDVFGLPKIAFNPTPVAPTPQPPAPPVAITQSLVLEAPYRELAGLLDQANLNLLDDTTSFIFAVASSPANSCHSYNMVARVQGATDFVEAEDTGTWCATALLSSSIGFTDTMITLKDGVLLDTVEVGTAAMIDDEVIRIDAVDWANNSLIIGRGCLDTLPATHKAGALVWFYDGSETSDGIEYNPGTAVEVKLLSNTFTEQLSLAQAPTQQIAVKGRQARPYAPGNFKINDEAYPSEVIGDTLTLTWAHRNRLIQSTLIIDTTAADIAPEEGTTYNLTITANGKPYKEETGFTGNSYELDITDLEIPSTITVELEAERDGFTSYQRYNYSFNTQKSPSKN